MPVRQVRRRVAPQKAQDVMRACPLGVSISQLSQLTETCGQRCSRWQLDRALRRVVPEMTPNGPLFRTFSAPAKNNNKPDLDVVYLDPGGTATLIAQQTAQFWPALSEVHVRTNGCIGLWLYCDGVTGGNVLNVKHAKEGHLVYWSIEDFGTQRLKQEQWWIPFATIRVNDEKDIDGGLTTIWTKILEVFFGTGATYNFQVWNRQGEVLRFEMALKKCLMDEAAEMQVNGSKGASGNKPCMKCQNVVHMKTKLELHSQTLVNIGEHRVNKIAFHTNSSIFNIWDELRERHGSRGFADMEKRLGFSWHYMAPLAQPFLRPVLKPVEQTVVDAMHTYVASNGIFQSELIQLALACEYKTDNKLNLDSIGKFCSKGSWETVGSHRGWFTERVMSASKSSGYYRGSAGECLSLFRIVAYWCESVALTWPQLVNEAKSMMALCWVMESVLLPGIVVSSHVDSIAARVDAASKHLELFKRAYPEQVPRHKHHQSIHCAFQLGDPNCFVGERKNKKYKTAVKNVHLADDQSCQWSRHLLSRMLADQLNMIDRSLAPGVVLVDPAPVRG